MIRHRRLRLLGLALAAAAAWTVAPGSASADDHRGDRHERDHWEQRDRDHGDRYERRDRDGDRYERRDRDDRWEHSDRERWERERRHDDRYDRHRRKGPKHAIARHDHGRRWERPRYVARPAPRFYRHPLRPGAWPFYCSEHRHGFYDRRHFDDHLVHFHHVPPWYFPRLVAHIGFGWTFGY